MVWRQLEEHVQEFWRAIQENADDDRTARRALAAKFFGRWPSGAPLALAPEIEDRSLEDANDFTYAADPYGFLTPFGSHIRRGNPRDWHVAPTTQKAIEVSNKHRIIRRGRPYGPPVAASMDPEDILHTPSAEADRNERGVHFVCFMTDIERQFEMIQSAWLNDSTFAGLYAEVDPMLGTPLAAGGALTVQATPIRRRLLGLSRFVTVRGAAYLFVPSLETVRSLVARRGD
jgi:deferrochelatase/peroxidase EfeB